MTMITNGESGASVRAKINTLFGKAPTPLAYGATLNPDATNPTFYDVTLTGNTVLGFPTDLTAGSGFGLIIRQDETGGRTMTFDSAYKFESGEAPVLTSAPNSIDIIEAWAFSETEIYAFILPDIR